MVEEGKLMNPIARGNGPLTRSQHGTLILVSVLALALRLAYLWGQARNNPLFLLPKVDAYWHQQWAEQIASGQGMEAEPYYRAPLYYYLLGGLYWLVGPSVLWGRLAGCALGALTTYLISRLGASLGGYRVGLIAGIFSALYWPAIYFDAELLTASLESLLGVSLLLALLRAGRGDGVWGFLGAGLIWGLASIARPNFLALAPIIGLWLLFLTPVVVSQRRKLARLALLSIGLGVVILPVTLRNLSVSGESILITYTAGVNLYIGNNPESTGISPVIPGARRSLEGGFRDAQRIPQVELGRPLSAQEVSDYWSGRALTWIQAEPSAWLKHMLYKARLFFSPIALPNNQPIWFFASMAEVSFLFWIGFPFIACLAVASLLPLRSRWREWFLPWGFAVTYAATVILFFVNARYRLPVYPVLTASAAAGLVEIAARLKVRPRRDVLAYGSTLVVMVIFFFTNPPFDREGFLRAGEGEGHAILGRHYASVSERGSANETRALSYFERAVKLKPGSPSLRIALAHQYLVMQRTAEAEQTMRRAAGHFPKVSEVRFEYGRLLNRSGYTIEAHHEFSEASRLQPAYAEVHQAMGCQLVAMKRHTMAEERLLRATGLDPTLLPAKLCLAQIRMQENRFKEATRLYQDVLAINASDSRALMGLADVSMLTNRLPEAARDYRAVLALDPALPSASQNLASALMRMGQYRASLSALENGVAASPADRPLRIELAWLLATAPEAALRNGPRALSIAQAIAAAQTQPSPRTLDAIAAAYAEMGRFEAAIESAQAGLILARAQGNSHELTAISNRLSQYRNGSPFHQRRILRSHPEGPSK